MNSKAARTVAKAKDESKFQERNGARTFLPAAMFNNVGRGPCEDKYLRANGCDWKWRSDLAVPGGFP